MAEKISLSDQAYLTIKERILNLTYPPGMQLTETMLADDLNMSRNPIRTALKSLHTEGLIVRDYYKSIKVKEITDKDISEIYQLRELLEGAAFREIFESGRAEEFSYRIEERVVRMCACAGDIYQWELADTQMHMEIVSVFDNERINRIYKTYLNEVIRMGLYSVRNGLPINKANDNLKKMIRYMRSGNYEKAYEILHNDHFLIGKSSALKK